MLEFFIVKFTIRFFCVTSMIQLSHMKCPDCGNTLKMAAYLGVNIYECDKCDGKWFGHDELKMAIDKKEDSLRWLDFNVFEDIEGKYASAESAKICPKCNTHLTAKKYSESSVLIGVCHKCGGVWLDKNEFQKIIKYLEHVVFTEPAKGYAKEVMKEFKEIFTGPQNKISEIKDFIAVVKLFELRLVVENPWIAGLSGSVNAAGLSLGI